MQRYVIYLILFKFSNDFPDVDRFSHIKLKTFIPTFFSKPFGIYTTRDYATVHTLIGMDAF